jgi:membrane protease subunit HflK
MRRWWWLLGLLVIAYLLTSVAQVGLNERAVVRRFGAVVARPGPGLYVGLPWPFERIDRVPVGYPHKVAVGFAPGDEGRLAAGQLLTGDQNLINVQAVLAYTVREDDDALEAFVLHRGQIDGLVARAAEAALAEWVAGHPIDEVLLTGKAALRGWLVKRTQERLEPYRLGVAVTAAEVVYLAPPDEVKPEFEHVAGRPPSARASTRPARRRSGGCARPRRRSTAARSRRRRTASRS